MAWPCGERKKSKPYKSPKEEYVRSPQQVSTRELAAKWKVPYSTLARRCAAEKWVDARAKFGSKVSALQQAQTAKDAEKVADAAAALYLQEEQRLCAVWDRMVTTLERGKGQRNRIVDTLGYSRMVTALVALDRGILLRRGQATVRLGDEDPQEAYTERRRRFLGLDKIVERVNGAGRGETLEEPE